MSADKPDLTKAPRRPWRLQTKGNLGNGIEAYAGRHTYEGDDGYRTVLLYQAPSDRDDERAAIAELVLRAVNGYDRHLALIAALTEALEGAPNPAKYVWNHGHSAQFFADYDAWRSRKIAALKLAKESGNER